MTDLQDFLNAKDERFKRLQNQLSQTTDISKLLADAANQSARSMSDVSAAFTALARDGKQPDDVSARELMLKLSEQGQDAARAGEDFRDRIIRQSNEMIDWINARADKPLKPEKIVMSRTDYDFFTQNIPHGRAVVNESGDFIGVTVSDHLPPGTAFKYPQTPGLFDYKVPMFVDIAGPYVYKPKAVTMMADIGPTRAEIEAEKKRHKAFKKLMYLGRVRRERGYTSPHLAKRIHELESALNLGIKTRKNKRVRTSVR